MWCHQFSQISKIHMSQVEKTTATPTPSRCRARSTPCGLAEYRISVAEGSLASAALRASYLHCSAAANDVAFITHARSASVQSFEVHSWTAFAYATGARL